MNKEIVGATVFFVILIFILIVWGDTNNSVPDLRKDTIENPNNNPCSGGDHPLDNCW